MKKVTYAFEVPDFCPDKCEAFSPIRAIRNDKMHCLYDDQCAELHRVLAGAAGGPGDPSPVCAPVRDDSGDGRQIAAPTRKRSAADGGY